jgi:hypothetical protein
VPGIIITGLAPLTAFCSVATSAEVFVGLMTVHGSVGGDWASAQVTIPIDITSDKRNHFNGHIPALC